MDTFHAVKDIMSLIVGEPVNSAVQIVFKENFLFCRVEWQNGLIYGIYGICLIYFMTIFRNYWHNKTFIQIDFLVFFCGPESCIRYYFVMFIPLVAALHSVSPLKLSLQEQTPSKILQEGYKFLLFKSQPSL